MVTPTITHPLLSNYHQEAAKRCCKTFMPERKQNQSVSPTSYEQEMVDWALQGFLPMGSARLIPTRTQEDEMQLVNLMPKSGEESEDDGDYTPNKRKKAELRPFQKKGIY